MSDASNDRRRPRNLSALAVGDTWRCRRTFGQHAWVRRTQLHGVGALTAGKILGRVGTITRFRSAAAFASYTGTAPIEVSSLSDSVYRQLVRDAADMAAGPEGHPGTTLKSCVAS